MEKLEIKNANHIGYTHDKLRFEILGGVNPESYHSLRVHLRTTYGRITHRDNVDLLNSEQTSNYVRKFVEATQNQLHRDKVKETINELVNELEEYKLDLQQQKTKPVVKSYQLSDDERAKAIETLKQPKLLSVINAMMDEAGIIGNETSRMILFLTYLTRKTNTSLHAVIQSQFNYLQNKVSELIPDEEKVSLGHLSESSLFYYGETELHNKVLLAEDIGKNRKRMIPLIGFQIGKAITRTTVIKNEYAELVTIQKHIRGNVCVSISTREEQAFTQNGVLSFVLSEDSGSVQDEKVLLYQRKQSAGLIKPYNEQKAIQQIQHLQRALAVTTVINPFALELQLPEQIQNKQITNLHYLRFVEVITFLKQYQRTKKYDKETGEEYIETTLEDIREANELLSEIFISKSDALNKPTRIYLEQLKCYLNTSNASGNTFTLHEVSLALKVPKTTVARYNRTLIEAGYIKATGQGNKKDGFLYQLLNVDEYQELRNSIAAAMNTNLKRLEKVKGSEPQTTSTQNKSGALNELESSALDEVTHKSQEGRPAKSVKTSKKAAA